MPTANTYVYQKPGPTLVSVTPTIAQTPVALGATIVVLAKFPQGPRVPTLCNAATAYAWFGQPTAAASSGYYGPLALQKMDQQINQVSNLPCTYLICRVGAACATATIVDGSSAVCLTLTAVGKYAGTLGANLAYTITLNVGNTAVATFNIFDTTSGTPVLLQQFIQGRDNLTSNQAIVDTINGGNVEINQFGPSPAIVQAAIGVSTNVPAAVTTATTFSGGSPNDGGAATYSDATIAPLLQQSLQWQAQFIAPLFDGASIYTSAIAAHQLAAIARLQWRFAYLGPERSTTFSSMAGSYS